MSKVVTLASELSSKSIPELLVPIITKFKSWIRELTELCKSSDDDLIEEEASQIERKHIFSMKPILKDLALYEAFAKPSSNHIYTKAINLVPLPQ